RNSCGLPSQQLQGPGAHRGNGLTELDQRFQFVALGGGEATVGIAVHQFLQPAIGLWRQTQGSHGLDPFPGSFHRCSHGVCFSFDSASSPTNLTTIVVDSLPTGQPKQRVAKTRASGPISGYGWETEGSRRPSQETDPCTLPASSAAVVAACCWARWPCP